MSKQKTPDDIQTTIGYRKPEISWQGHPRAHGFYAERGGSTVSDYYPSIFDAVYAYPDAVIDKTAISQLTKGEKRMLAKPATSVIPKAGAENLVSISEKFHTHPHYDAFYERYCDTMNGFLGCYDLVIRMAETLTEWEEKKGGSNLYDSTEVIWDEVVDSYVDKYFEAALSNDDSILPSAASVFKTIEPKQKDSRQWPKRPVAIILSDTLDP